MRVYKLRYNLMGDKGPYYSLARSGSWAAKSLCNQLGIPYKAKEWEVIESRKRKYFHKYNSYFQELINELGTRK